MTSKKSSVSDNTASDAIATKDQCNICNSSVKAGDKGIMCESCKLWFHVKCVGINLKLYDLLQLEGAKQIHWFCSQCDSKVMEICNITVRCEKIEKELIELKYEINNKADKDTVIKSLQEFNNLKVTLHKDVEKDMNKIKAEVDSELQKIHMVVDDLHTELNSVKNINKAVDFNEIVKQQMEDEVRKNAEFTEKIVEDKLKITSKAVEEMSNKFQESKSYFEEEQDKEIRRNNIIIYRMPEHLEVSIPEERKVLDKRFVLNLFNNMQAGIIEEDVRATLRLGRLTVQGFADTATGRATANPRPVLVQFTNRMAKNLVMNNLYKLKNLEEKFKNLSIAHDMTKQERKECKDLVEEAKKQSAEDTTGNYIYRARGAPGAMQIVRLRKMH